MWKRLNLIANHSNIPMTKTFTPLALLAILCISSCQIAAIQESNAHQMQQLTITADLEDDGAMTIDGEETIPETKTTRRSDGKIWWTPTDAISLFYGEGTNGGSEFTSTLTENAAIARFSGEIDVITGGGDDGVEAYSFWGVYPYRPDNECNGSYVTFTLPAAQESGEGDLGKGQWPTVATSTALAMSFRNVACGYKFKVQIPGITSVAIRTDNRADIYPLAGRITVGMSLGQIPTMRAITQPCRTVTVVPEGGGSFKPGVYYYAVMLPGFFGAGVSMTFFTDTQKATYNCIIDGDKPEYPSGRGKFKVMDNKDGGLYWSGISAPLPGEFSVSATKKVSFSRGNLYYNNAGNYWKEQQNQSDYYTLEGKQCSYNGVYYASGSPEGSIGTFNWNLEASGAASTSYSDYPTGADDLFFANADPTLISPKWFALSKTEWDYILHSRANASKKYGNGTVQNVKGMILLPDSFTDPMKNGGSGAFVPQSSLAYTNNIYDKDGWTAMEKAGAVFLPAVGYRDGKQNSDVGEVGYYWTSTAYDAQYGYYLRFSSTDYPSAAYFSYRSYGFAVRLVTEVK